MSTGRGRLSSIELLGEDYDDVVLWAAGELRARNQLQIDILGEFNKRLQARAEEIGDDDFEPVSKSAFNRYAMRLAGIARRLEHTREISRVLTDRLQPGDTDTVTIALAEAIKTAVFEAIGEAGDAGMGMMDLKFAGDALKSAVTAQKHSSERRARLEAEAQRQAEAMAAQLAKRAADAVEKAATEAGLSAAAIAQLRRDFLGIRPAKPAESAGGGS
ncbi:DUF3486 family protein [Prosthecodimorpha staleyi]|uniref:DUF3486 family protein n=1 Tax=Prosthecodimorpha staleyi TaxID=2840188 RepID=A0A947GFV3_9HYPH|nr:DUF3486 family protein [Prosthecodimorpha staleyi]MBT9293316.1 DUF3486 family protein [Prosthecodimorpha staleyi]